jgi:ABC-type transporter Mla MlaB component
MLRISTLNFDDHTVLKLEGRVSGPWIEELESSWQLARATSTTVEITLCDVSHVDARGKALLTRLHREGARLVARDCEMRALVEEIEAEGSSGC